jgi:hypothetical protein
VALGLDNTNAPEGDDSLSLKTVKLLMDVRTQNATVNEQLQLSVDEEEDVTIAYRAAIALLRNGVTHAPAVELIQQNAANNELSQALLKAGKDALDECTADLHVKPRAG